MTDRSQTIRRSARPTSQVVAEALIVAADAAGRTATPTRRAPGLDQEMREVKDGDPADGLARRGGDPGGDVGAGRPRCGARRPR